MEKRLLEKSAYSKNLAYIVFSVLVICFAVVSISFAWAPPNGTPPAYDASTPLNVGSTTQGKVGNLDIGPSDLTGFPTGKTLRITDTTSSPGLQLQYGTDTSNDHWYIYNSQTADDLRIWSYNGSTAASGDRLTILQNGNVGIGTNTPGAKLEIAGQIKITGGTPGLGKVLTSDANGLASWQAPISCTPNWQTGAWGACTSGQQTRTVTDSNNCGATTNGPATTQSCTLVTVPSAPQNLKYSFYINGPNSISNTLSWSAPSNGGSTITNYYIYQSSSSGAETYFATVGNVLTYTRIGNFNEYYKVSAVTAAGEGPMSNEALPLTGTRPSAPYLTGINCTINNPGSNCFQWYAPSSNGSTILLYETYCANQLATHFLHFDVNNLTENFGWCLSGAYQVSAFNSAGEGPGSNIVSQ